MVYFGGGSDNGDEKDDDELEPDIDDDDEYEGEDYDSDDNVSKIGSCEKLSLWAYLYLLYKII